MPLTRRQLLRAALAAALVAVAAITLAPVPLRAQPVAQTAPAGPSPCFRRPSTLSSNLYVADVGQPRGFSTDEQLMFASLQGIVNRGGPQIYLEGEISDTTSATWLADGVVPLPTQIVQPYDLLARFASSLKGLVVWDPDLATDTQNVATTIAGAEGLLPVSPTLAASL